MTLLVRGSSRARLAESVRHGPHPEKASLVQADLIEEGLGVDECTRHELRDHVDHVDHIVALYDLDDDDDTSVAVNVRGTRGVLELAPEMHRNEVTFTTIHMPLVRTPMIRPMTIYHALPARSFGPSQQSVGMNETDVTVLGSPDRHGLPRRYHRHRYGL